MTQKSETGWVGVLSEECPLQCMFVWHLRTCPRLEIGLLWVGLSSAEVELEQSGPPIQ